MKPLNLGTVSAACKIVGGDKPIHVTTYYRGVARGIYPRPKRVSPNIVRVDLDELAAVLRARMNSEGATSVNTA
jgi:hypothetical protein